MVSGTFHYKIKQEVTEIDVIIVSWISEVFANLHYEMKGKSEFGNVLVISDCMIISHTRVERIAKYPRVFGKVRDKSLDLLL